MSIPHVETGTSIFDEGGDRNIFFVFDSIYILLGVQCAVSIYCEITEGGLSNEERRINFAARIFGHASFVIPAIVFMSLVNDFGKLQAAILQSFWLSMAIIITSLVFVVTSPTDFLARPILCIPIVFCVCLCSFGAQCVVMGISSNTHWADATNAFVYIVGAICNFKAIYNVYKLVTGKTVTGREMDAIVLVFTASAWLILYRAERGGSSFTTASYNIDYRVWLYYRFGGGCFFLFIWNIRSTLFTLKRIESEEKREQIIQSRVLHMERQMAIKLLHTMVPPKIANDLSRGVEVPPEMYAFATVYFSDIEGFTRFASIKTPLEVFNMLNRLFEIMDYCVSLFPRQLYKIETIGDAYMVVGGILTDIDNDNDVDNNSLKFGSTKANEELNRQMEVVNATCQFALLVREAVQMVPFDEISFVKIRMGIHTGSIVTGLSGTIIPRFSCYGDTVNTASRMESTGVTNKIHVSGSFADAVRKIQLDCPYYELEPRSPVEVKGKGKMQTFFLETGIESFRLQHSKTLTHIDTLLRKCNKKTHYALGSDGLGGALKSTELDHEALPSTPFSLDQLRVTFNNFNSKPKQRNNSYSLVTDVADIGLVEEGKMNIVMLPLTSHSFDVLMSPDYNVMQLCGDFEGICNAILQCFSGVVGSPGCSSVTDPRTLERLIRRVGTHYLNVPYHNFHHAFCVVQQMAYILMKLDLISSENILSERERFIIMLSALVHDVDHPGHNNYFEVRTKSSLALLYNDQSVLENHHLALAFNIMSNKAYNVFMNWEPEAAVTARKNMIACVLATDMDAHNSLQDELIRRHSRLEKGNCAFDFSKEDDKVAMAKCLLHAADISNPTRNFETSAKIAMLAIQEFNQQAIDEERMGIPVTQFMVTPDFASKCRGEIFFASCVAKPYFAALKSCFPCISLERWDPVKMIEKNVERWKEQATFPELRISPSFPE